MLVQLSAGGYGHVPIPLCAGSQVIKPHKETQATLGILTERIKYMGVFGLANEFQKFEVRRPIKQRHEYLLGLSGTVWGIRYKLHQQLSDDLVIKNDKNITKIMNDRSWGRYKCNPADATCQQNWKIFYSECCKFMGLPRGRGPTTKQICEFMRLKPNAVPVYRLEKAHNAVVLS